MGRSWAIRARRTGTWGWIALMWLVASPSHAVSTNFELWELTGGLFARNVYLCPDCTLEQFLAVPLPGPNWEKNASESSGTRLFLPDSATSSQPPPTPGTPASFDFVTEIPGDDHFLVAQVLGGAVVGLGFQGPMARVQVARNTSYTFLAGRVVHKVMDTNGDEFVLFSMNEAVTATFDPDVVDGLATMSLPIGWSYSSEVLADALTVTTQGGVAEVFTVPEHFTFQMVLPEPGAGLLLAVALMGLRRRRAAIPS